MPEIGEVARTVHHLRQHLVGKTLSNVKAIHDESVYGKVGTSAAELEKALSNKKVVGAGQQGKYFWILMSSPPHPVMHFGMTGWMHFRNVPATHYRPEKGHKDTDEWPPKYSKFAFDATSSSGGGGKDGTDGDAAIGAAFVDSRRFARIRLVDCPADRIRDFSPLKENGPDPVIDKAVVTEKWLADKCTAKRVPIKAMLLDQANISGIGNWVGDEILYGAAIHPEQYANTLSRAQISRLHSSMMHVTSVAVSTLADSSKFPKEWMFNYRWSKGKKDAPGRLPNGDKFVFLTVGGRTSCVVPSVQKKTGPTSKDIENSGEDEDDMKSGEDAATTSNKKKKNSKSSTENAGKRKREAKEQQNEQEQEKEQEQEQGTELSAKPGKPKTETNGILNGPVPSVAKKKKVSAEKPNATKATAKKTPAINEEEKEEEEEEGEEQKRSTTETKPKLKKTQAPERKDSSEAKAKASKNDDGIANNSASGRRRSARLSGA